MHNEIQAKVEWNMGTKLGGYRRRELAWLYLFVAPPVLGFLLFGLVPILFSIYISFHKWDMLTDPQWTGLANYKDLLKDEKVFKSLYNTVYLMIGIPLGMILSIFAGHFDEPQIRRHLVHAHDLLSSGHIADYRGIPAVAVDFESGLRIAQQLSVGNIRHHRA